MERAIRDTARRWLAAGVPAVVVEVSDAKGSAPRERGARMVVSAHDAAGTVGGGHLELKALQSAREMLRTGETSPRREQWTLGPSLGQCCGGAVALAFAPLDEAALGRWAEPPPRFALQLYGAGHVGRAIAALLATLDVAVDWIDERDAQFPAALPGGAPWPAHIRRVCVDAVEAEVREAPPGGLVLVLTHSHDLDLRIVEAALRRDDLAFVGLIGSRTKRARFARRLAERGLADAAVARLVCPIGVPGIAGKAPEVVAVAVVAQLLQRSG